MATTTSPRSFWTTTLPIFASYVISGLALLLYGVQSFALIVDSTVDVVEALGISYLRQLVSDLTFCAAAPIYMSIIPFLVAFLATPLPWALLSSLVVRRPKVARLPPIQPTTYYDEKDNSILDVEASSLPTQAACSAKNIYITDLRHPVHRTTLRLIILYPAYITCVLLSDALINREASSTRIAGGFARASAMFAANATALVPCWWAVLGWVIVGFVLEVGARIVERKVDAARKRGRDAETVFASGLS